MRPMPHLHRLASLSVLALTAVCGVACAAANARAEAPATTPAKEVALSMLKVDRAKLTPVDASEVVIAPDPATRRPPFAFSDEDGAFLTEVQHGCFNFLWNAGDPRTGMVPDRSSITTVSVAGVGFQLSALPVGVSRGWITAEQALQRTDQILTVLTRDPSIRAHGLYQHYIDGITGGPHTSDLEQVVSTIDSAILMAGVLTISSYLRTDAAFTNNADAVRVANLADAIFAGADWRAFVSGDWTKPYERGYVSLGWKAGKTGKGELLPYFWADSGCEHRLVTFLGVCAPDEMHRLDPAMYYRLRRPLGVYRTGPAADAPLSAPMVYLPFSGALFTNQFSHVWMDYANLGPDNPHAWGMVHRARVDWWENSRRLTKMQIDVSKASGHFPADANGAGFGWGLTAMDAPKGYAVPGMYPTRVPMRGAATEFDYSTFVPANDFGDGTLAPYGAGCAILFLPDEAVKAMRYYRSLAETTAPGLWNDPSKGGYGFQDSFNTSKSPVWVAHDVVAIDAGPLILMIENARTGQVQRLFMQHPFVQDGLRRLKLGEGK